MSDEPTETALPGVVLLQTVGTGRTPDDGKTPPDPGNPVWEALAFAWRHLKPQLLVQLCSPKSAEETIPRFDAALTAGERAELSREVRVHDRADDAEALADAYRAIIDELRSRLPGARIEADFTSGTKAMSAALLVAALDREAARVHYAVGPRDAGGRATETKELVTLQPVASRADRLLRQLGDLFNRGQYLAVYTQAETLASALEGGVHRDLYARAASLAFLARAYERWDLFAWRDAFAMLREYRRPEHAKAIERAGWDGVAIGRQVPFLKGAKESAAGAPPTEQRLADLLMNAERCMMRGAFDDAVCRLYRLVEYIAQGRLLMHGIDPGKSVTRDMLHSLAPREAARLFRARATCKLGLFDGVAVLDEMQDPVGAFIFGRLHGVSASDSRPIACDRYGAGDLGTLLGARNQSLLAHGVQSVGETTARDLLEILRTTLARHFDHRPADQGMSGDGRLRLQELRSVAKFLRCPWVA